MGWLTTTTRRLFDTTPCLNLTLDDQSDETLLVDENAETVARKRRETQSENDNMYLCSSYAPDRYFGISLSGYFGVK